jgi:hypothetical protein
MKCRKFYYDVVHELRGRLNVLSYHESASAVAETIGIRKKFDTKAPKKMSIFKRYGCELLRRLVAFVKKIPPVNSY